jgi:hypothetical protein
MTLKQGVGVGDGDGQTVEISAELRRQKLQAEI